MHLANARLVIDSLCIPFETWLKLLFVAVVRNRLRSRTRVLLHCPVTSKGCFHFGTTHLHPDLRTLENSTKKIIGGRSTELTQWTDQCPEHIMVQSSESGLSPKLNDLSQYPHRAITSSPYPHDKDLPFSLLCSFGPKTNSCSRTYP